MVAKPTTLSFPRKRESSLSNNLREADKAVFEVLSHFVGASLIVWIPAFADTVVIMLLQVPIAHQMVYLI